MLLRRISIQNVRSFLEPQEIILDGSISIIIGPNGGGKTNLLDTCVVLLRKFLFASPYLAHVPVPGTYNRWEIRYNDQLNNLILEKHSAGADLQQIVEIEIEITPTDIKNMREIQSSADNIVKKTDKQLINNPWNDALAWNTESLLPHTRHKYILIDGQLKHGPDSQSKDFLSYLRLFEIDNQIRSEVGETSLQMPMVYLPINRAASGLLSRVNLSGYSDYEAKRTSDASTSRISTNILQLAIGRLAQKFRLLQENENTNARELFNSDQNLRQLSAELEGLGYSWDLKTINPFTNEYDISLTKQNSNFLVSAASSGERELLTYLFAIYALNIRNALLIIDEPELHLHPKWQLALLDLFERLSKSTGNQFLIATHSPTFVSPSSVQYISRVYSKEQKSRIVRLNSSSLPNAKHLFNIVNTQNNERVFFCDKVVLVEGISDRIFFERMMRHVSKTRFNSDKSSVEIVSVGGKGFFSAYQKLLSSCAIPTFIIADRDYIEQLGNDTIKNLFHPDAVGIKKHVIDDKTSLDGSSLVARINEAMSSGDWSEAQHVWKYIQSRHRKLKDDLSSEEMMVLKKFIQSKAAEGTFILALGSLEEYLPAGLRTKDMKKFIDFVSTHDFWQQLPCQGKIEIEDIIRQIIG